VLVHHGADGRALGWDVYMPAHGLFTDSIAETLMARLLQLWRALHARVGRPHTFQGSGKIVTRGLTKWFAIT